MALMMPAKPLTKIEHQGFVMADVETRHEIVSRKEAIERGFTNYFTGKPCKRGHVTKRNVASLSCLLCAREAHMRWTNANRELGRERYRKRYWSDPAFRKKVSDYGKWYRKNRSQVARATRQNCKAKRRKALGSHTKDDIKEICKLQRNKCAICRVSIKKKYEVDHIVALSKGGTNFRQNIQLLCKPCNRRKHNKDPMDAMRRLGRLL